MSEGGEHERRPQFVVLATDKPGSLELRQQVRPDHRLYLRQHGVPGARVVLAGPTLEASAGTMNGTMLVVEADGVDTVARLLEADPYSRAGLFENVDIRPWICGLGEIRGQEDV